MFHLKCKVHELYAPLSRLRAGTVRARALPILDFVYLRGGGDAVAMTITDMEITLSDTLKVEDVNGEILLPTEKLTHLLRLLPPDAALEIEDWGQGAKLSCGSSRYRFQTWPPAEFPLGTPLQRLRGFVLSAANLRRHLEAVMHAQAKRDVRFYLNGTLFDLREKSLVLVATNGHCLAISCNDDTLFDSATEATERPCYQAVLPVRAVEQLHRMAQFQQDGLICLSLLGVEASSMPTSFRASADDFVMTSNLIDGKFPDYGRILPESHFGWLQVDREALLQTLQRITLLAHPEYHGVVLEPDIDTMKVSANYDVQEAEEVLPIERQGGLPTRYALNASYLIAALTAVDGDQIRLHFRDEGAGMEINLPDRPDWREIIMPMRV